MGVIFKFPNLEEIFNKIGYKDEVIKSGNLKDLGSPSRSLTLEERDLLQSLLDEVHEQFIADISKSRNLSNESVRSVADGRIFSGEKAKELGLVDELGNFNDAVLLAAQLAGITGKTPKLIYPEENQFSFLKILAEQKLGMLFRNFPQAKPLLSYEWTHP